MAVHYSPLKRTLNEKRMPYRHEPDVSKKTYISQANGYNIGQSAMQGWRETMEVGKDLESRSRFLVSNNPIVFRMST